MNIPKYELSCKNILRDCDLVWAFPNQRASPSSQRQGVNEEATVSWGKKRTRAFMWWQKMTLETFTWKNSHEFNRGLTAFDSSINCFFNRWCPPERGGNFCRLRFLALARFFFRSICQLSINSKWLPKRQLHITSRLSCMLTFELEIECQLTKTFRRTRFVRFATFSGCVSSIFSIVLFVFPHLFYSPVCPSPVWPCLKILTTLI